MRRPWVVLRHTIVSRGRGATPVAGLVLTTRGELAWQAGGRVVAETAGSRRRVLARDASGALTLEDDRTVVWFVDDGHRIYADLRPWTGRGCPRRERFSTVLDTAHVLVTQAIYGGDSLRSASVIRACLKRTRADRVIWWAGSAVGSGFGVRPAGAWGPWVVLVSTSFSRYWGCECAWVRTVHARTGATGREGAVPYCTPGRLPRIGHPVAVTDGGVPAWIVRGNHVARLFAPGSDGAVAVLDEGGRDAIADLRADGERIHWTHDGEPRAADLGS